MLLVLAAGLGTGCRCGSLERETQKALEPTERGLEAVRGDDSLQCIVRDANLNL
jgi:hypothetical protein